MFEELQTTLNKEIECLHKKFKENECARHFELLCMAIQAKKDLVKTEIMMNTNSGIFKK